MQPELGNAAFIALYNGLPQLRHIDRSDVHTGLILVVGVDWSNGIEIIHDENYLNN